MPNVELNIIVNSNLDQELKKSAAASEELNDSTKSLSATATKGFDDAAKSSKKLSNEQKKQKKITDDVAKSFKGAAKAKDKATKTAGVKKLNKELDKTEKKADGVGRSFKRVGGALIAAFGAREIFQFASSSIDAFRQQEAAVAKVRQGIESTNAAARGLTLENLKQEASDLQSNTLFGDEEILNGATAQLLTFTNIGGEEFKRTQKVALDLATVLDGDLQSASIQLGKALNDPVANLSALSRSGIQFTKQQKDQIKVLTESGKLQEAQGVILSELERQYGGQAEAAAEADGGITQLGNAFGDVKEKIGATLVDALQPFIQGLKEFFESLTQEDIDNFLSTLKTLGKVVLSVLAGFVAYKTVLTAISIAQKAASFFTTAYTIATKGVAVANQSATASTWLLNIAMNANPAGVLVAAFVALGAAVAALAFFFSGANSELSEVEIHSKAVQQATEDLSGAFIEEATAADKSFNALEDANTSKEDALAIIENLEKQYDVYLDDLKDEEGLLVNIEEAQKRVNESILEGVVARIKSEQQQEKLTEVAEAELARAELRRGKISESITESQKEQAQLESVSFGISGLPEIDEELFAESLERQLNEQIEEAKTILENQDDVFAEAGQNIISSLEGVDLAGGLTEGPPAADPAKTEAELKKDQDVRNKASETRRKSKLAEANALFKVEQDLIKTIADLRSNADKANEDLLSDSELIDLRERQAIEEIALVEDTLKEKIALVEIERQFTKEQLAKLSAEELQARTDTFKAIAELNEDQIGLLNELRAAALREANDERIALDRELQGELNDAQLDSTGERIKQQELQEEALLLGLEDKRSDFGDLELAFEAFKEEESLRIKRAGLDRRIELIDEETRLKLLAIDLEIAALEASDDAQSQARAEALQLQKETLQAQTANAKKELENEGNAIDDELQKISDKKSKFSLANVLGLTDEEFGEVAGAVGEFGQAVVGEINSSLDAQLAANDKLTDSISANIDDTEAAISREIAKRDAGYASNIEGKEEELANLKRQEQEALKEREKIVKQQLILDTVTQASGLITSATSILQGFAKIPVVGLPLGIAAVAAMLSFFIKAKATAFGAAGFHDGGYTGDGNEWGVSGAVHNQEFVSTKKTTDKHRNLLEALHGDDMNGVESYMKDFLFSRGIDMNPETPEVLTRKVQQVKRIERTEQASANSDATNKQLDALNHKVESFMTMVDNKPQRWSDEYFDYTKIGGTTRRKPRRK